MNVDCMSNFLKRRKANMKDSFTSKTFFCTREQKPRSIQIRMVSQLDKTAFIEWKSDSIPNWDAAQKIDAVQL